ncbi:MAG TPA: chlorite dismutase family protein [Anaerolineae bacterium]|nr:chlorite dismutase family protein [Anaerolineae bacterium]
MALDIQRHAPEGPDVFEHGRTAEGEAIHVNWRLYMQFLAYGECERPSELSAALQDAEIAHTIYADLNDPLGVGVLTFDMDPNFFVDRLRPVLVQRPFVNLVPKPEFTMFGRTYAIGYESDLERTLIGRPRGRVLDPETPWAIWYPLRRKGEFEQLSAAEQRSILMEHGGIGRAFGEAGYGSDIRLACHGLDTHDNDFVIALIGKELNPLSRIVQRMRKTKQTSQFLEKLGPFFIGKALYQYGGPEAEK